MEKITDVQVICENCGWQGMVGAPGNLTTAINADGEPACPQCGETLHISAPPVPQESGVRYPGISANLIDQNSNAFFILGTVRRALNHAGVSAEEITKFQQEATSGDYDHLLQTVQRWVNVE
jgi:hypothetical protein